MNDDRSNGTNRILTVPNLLSVIRLCLIPLLVWLYNVQQNYSAALVVLLISAATDIVDGKIARRFHMVSDLGKVLDSAADKLTQIAMLGCLVRRFPHMMIPFGILIAKEILAAILNMLEIRKAGVVYGAVWHGKLNTVLLYFMMALHLLWTSIPAAVSNVLIGLCTVVMLLSAILYTASGIKVLKGQDKKAA